MIPSLLQIPSAVSDSKLHSVLPNNGKGDFQFDRSTGATRINRDGLIEEVGYFSSELVQNGNFSELGSEKVTNGDFATDSDWTKGTGWSISNGKAVGSNSSSSLYQATGSNYTSGKTYKIVFTVSDYVSGSVRPEITNVAGDYVTSNGTFTQYIVATSSGIGEELKGASFNGSIDNVSVKQVDPNDRWALTSIKFTGANTFENTATNGKLHQSYTTVVGSKYKVSATINSGTWNVVASTNDNTSGQIASTSNTTTSEFFEFTATGTTTFILLYNIGASGSVASITDASVVEVQGDRPRLSYDITNGVVEDKPHLLLEPSATNLFNFSEDYSQSYWTKSSVTLTSGFLAPDGSLNASKLVANASDSSLRIDFNATSGTTYSLSFYLKTTSGTLDTTIGLGSPAFPQNEGEGGRYKNITVTNEWQRYTLTSTADATANTGISFGGFNGFSTGEEVLIFAAQLETTGYPTSYIPTAGTTITRAAETCLKTDLSNSIGQTEGTLFFDVNISHIVGNEALGGINSGGYANHVTIQRIGNTIQYVRTSATQSGSLVVSSGTITAGRHKIAIKYKSGDSDCFLNGEKIGATQTQTFTNGTLNVVRIGADAIGSIPINGGIYGLAVYNEALSESQLMQLTGVTASSIYNNFVTRTASFTVEALNEVKKVIDNL